MNDLSLPHFIQTLVSLPDSIDKSEWKLVCYSRLIYQSSLNFCEPAITQGSLNQCPVSIESPKATCFSEFKLLSTRNTTASYESTVLIRSSNIVNKPDHVTLGWFSWHPLFISSGESTSLNHSQISTDSSALMIFPVHYLKSVSRFNCIIRVHFVSGESANANQPPNSLDSCESTVSVSPSNQVINNLSPLRFQWAS